MCDLKIAYLAGIIDADGFISAHRRKRGDAVYCSPLIGISGTSSEPHLLAQSFWGGSFFSYVPKNPSHREQFQWQAVGGRAAAAITAIRPHLLTKCRQADIALEMWRLIDCGVHRTDIRLLEMGAALSQMNLRRPPLKILAGHA